MRYSYHNRIRQRISNGELSGIMQSENNDFAFILLFSTPPHTRPVRFHSVWRYEDVLDKYDFNIPPDLSELRNVAEVPDLSQLRGVSDDNIKRQN